MQKAIFNWSGGKDSAHALLKVLNSAEYQIIALCTAVDPKTKRSTLHNLPICILKRQAKSIGLPLYVIQNSSTSFIQNIKMFKSKGVSHFIFGDIFLDGVRQYREEKLAPFGITVVEPLWGKTSREIMNEYLRTGLKAIIINATEKIGVNAIGRELDKAFVESLPSDIDPNGENGEYHTLCYDGPIFRKRVSFHLYKPFPVVYENEMIRGNNKSFFYSVDIK